MSTDLAMKQLELGLVRRSRVPVMMQAEASECGLACIAMIGAYYGHSIDLNGLRQKFALSIAGTNLRGLIEIADTLGLATRAIRIELEALASVRLPMIAHWNLNHFVVVTEFSKNTVVIHDPAVGRRRISLDSFSKHFTGVALEAFPTAHFEPIHAESGTRISSLWTRIDGIGPALTKVLALSVLLQIIAFAGPLQVQLVVDEAVARSDNKLLLSIALGFAMLIVLQACVQALRDLVLQVLGSLVSFQVVGNLVRHLLRLRTEYFEKRSVGDIISRIRSSEPLRDALTRGLMSSILDGSMALAAAALLFLYSLKLAVVAVVGVLLAAALRFAFYTAVRGRSEEEIAAAAKEQTHLMESVRASTIIKLMGRESEREGSWRNLYAAFINAKLSVSRLRIYSDLFQQVISGLSTIAIITIGAKSTIDGDGMTVGMLMAFLAFRQTFADRSENFFTEMFNILLLRVHVSRLSDIVSAEVEAPVSALGRFDCPQGAISLKDVDFRYGATDKLTIRGANFSIEPGDFVAFVGPSGSGKTTIAKLILGLYAPTAGSILLDGRDATPGRWVDWRRHIGFVAQDDRLLSGSIADNIAFFDPETDMEKVQMAAIQARVHEEIVQMPMQYMTLVGDMGSALSGGQRQRILLARALYRSPKILLLDEGTANLDIDNEAAISELVAELPITRIVVAHRPALVKRANRVFRVECGCVTEVFDNG